MTASVVLDHLAIGVRSWADAFPRFVVDLGGRWSHGGDAGGYAPYQLVYRHGMRLEFIAPSGTQGFMRRFIDRDGPGAHHITFKVPSLDETLARVAEIGIEPLPGRTDLPFWREAFLHPKQCGMGTLLQLAQTDEEFLSRQVRDVPTPDGFPSRQGAQQGIAWTALTVESLDHARALLVDILQGTVGESGDHWLLIRWGTGRSLLVRDSNATPGGEALWQAAPTPGVAHVMIGPADLSPLDSNGMPARRLRDDDAIGVPVWMAQEAGAR